MKLYANVIGRKNGLEVEKGQGSNQSLTIEIKAQELLGIPTRANIYRLSLNVGNNNELQAELLDYSTGEVIELTKGEAPLLCPKYKEQVLPDENGDCSLCGEHKADVCTDGNQHRLDPYDKENGCTGEDCYKTAVEVNGIKIKGERQKGECSHIFTTAIYNDRKLQGYRCNSCGVKIEVNPQYKKGEKQKGECVYHGVVNCSRCDEFKH